MFDTVRYTCPNCGEEASTQTKAGDCNLNVYTEYDLPDDIAISFIKYGVPYPCESCGESPKFIRPPLGVFVKRTEDTGV